MSRCRLFKGRQKAHQKWHYEHYAIDHAHFLTCLSSLTCLSRSWGRPDSDFASCGGIERTEARSLRHSRPDPPLDNQPKDTVRKGPPTGWRGGGPLCPLRWTCIERQACRWAAERTGSNRNKIPSPSEMGGGHFLLELGGGHPLLEEPEAMAVSRFLDDGDGVSTLPLPSGAAQGFHNGWPRWLIVGPLGVCTAGDFPAQTGRRPSQRASRSPSQSRRPWWRAIPTASVRPNGPTVPRDGKSHPVLEERAAVVARRLRHDGHGGSDRFAEYRCRAGFQQ